MSPATKWLLTALQYRGVGAAAVRKLAHEFSRSPSAPEAIISSQRTALESDRASNNLAEEAATKIAEKCITHSVKIISLADRDYPPRLRLIKDAPPILYVRGSMKALSYPGCAVVGTRHSTAIGEKIAARIAGVLSQAGIITVSGLALGIDAAAHGGALDAGGITVAIMAHGLDKVHPASNRKLAERLLDSGGALIAEHEPGVPPRPAEFVRRNRIQSGMSLCSIVVESGAVGGSIHQARFTKDQGRPILTVLPDLSKCSDKEFNYEGGRYLVQSLGAIPLTTTEDLRLYLDRLIVSGESAQPVGDQHCLEV